MSPSGYGQTPYGQEYGGGTMTKSATLTLVASEEGELTITVETEDGTGVEGFDVTISATDESGFSETMTTDSGGSVVFTGLVVRAYDVEGTKPGWLGVSGSVASGDFTSS